MEAIEKLQEIINNSRSIVFFGGAGVSTASGIADFRSVDGLYNQEYDYPPEKILSHTFFLKNTEEFYRFYKKKILILEALPNAAHKKLAEFEQAGKLTSVVTQNIDGLHQKAGSRAVWELHGSIHRNECMRCHESYTAEEVYAQEGIPVCRCGGIIKPDVVLYEEGLDSETMDGAVKDISNADTLIIGGTSLAVYPAAGLLQYYRGNQLVLINKSITPMDQKANLLIHHNIADVFEKIRV